MSEAPAEPRKKYGPVRRIYRVVYWLISLNLMLSTAVGVTLHVFRDPEGVGPRVPEGTTPDSPEGQTCRGDLQRLYQTLQLRLMPVVAETTQDTLAHDWQDFTQHWRSELDRTRHRCRLDTDAMAPLAEVARDLERLRVAYTTAVNGFADGGRDALNRLEAAFGAPTRATHAPPPDGRFPPARPE